MKISEASFYPKIYELAVKYFVAGSSTVFYKVAGEIAMRFDNLEMDPEVSPLPAIKSTELGWYFPMGQIHFMNRLNLFNPGNYPTVLSAGIESSATRDGFLIVENQYVSGVNLGERFVKKDIWKLFVSLKKEVESTSNEKLYLLHGYRSEGYQLLLRAWMVGTFPRLYNQLKLCAPSGASTHSTRYHAIDFGTEESILGEINFKQTHSYRVISNINELKAPYNFEPWHFQLNEDFLKKRR